VLTPHGGQGGGGGYHPSSSSARPMTGSGEGAPERGGRQAGGVGTCAEEKPIMSIEGVPFDKIDETHIRILYDNKVPEGRTLEYKQDVYEKNENGEFAKDVSAMANSLGGHIIIGGSRVWRYIDRAMRHRSCT
jgi:hypothetical protein